MKVILSSLVLFILLSGLRAQEIDTLQNHSNYKRALDTALADGKISQEERALLNILVESLMLPLDSSKIWERRKLQPLNKPPDQSGRWPLVMQNMVIGSGLYGWGIPYVLHAEDSRWFVGGVMMSAGGAFYLTYEYTKSMNMSHSRAQMMRYGSLLGLRYGQGINQLLGLDGGDGEKRETAWAWVLMASIPAGLYGGEYLFDQYNPSNGQAWAWTMWTGVAGLTTRLAYDVVSKAPDDEFGTEYDNWDKNRTLFELLSYPVGIYYGNKLVENKQYSFGDALMLIQGWGYGYFNTMMLQSILFDEGDMDTYALVAGLGAIGGTFAYDHYIQNYDYSFGQATLMLLGSASGTAFGFGTAILVDVREKEAFLSMAMAGYGVGTWLTSKILDVETDGSLTREESSGMSISPTIIPSVSSDNKVSLVPGLNFRLSIK